MSVREEFVMLAHAEGSNIRELCRRFGISPKTGYKWIARYAERGREGLEDRSRRPHRSPCRTTAGMQEQVVRLRRAHPAWGGRKLKRRLQDLGHRDVPAASTITEILRRQGLLDGARGGGQRIVQRFEHAAPNDLWQMDFKGHFGLTRGGRCHPLTVLDDHSRYAIALQACRDERRGTVQSALTASFRRYGMPRRMLMDNGAPWGDAGDQPWTKLTVWLIRLGIGVSHGRPFHPQTQGKDERFHRTLKVEVLFERSFRDLGECQQTFDPWRLIYNTQRPHEALDLAVPASRYLSSGRSFPEVLPSVEYDRHVVTRKVQQGNGVIVFQRRQIRVGKAFCGEHVGLNATGEDAIYQVWYARQCIGHVDLRETGPGKRGILPLRRPQRESSGAAGGSSSVRYAHSTRTAPAPMNVFGPWNPLPMSPNTRYP